MSFAKIVLLLFSILYFLLGFWCAFLPETTSTTIGLSLIGKSGHSEYFVVYAGLEIALGLFFLLSFLRQEYFQAGILFAFLSSACLCICRIMSFIVFANLDGQFSNITFITFVTECLMTFFSGLAFYKK